MHWAPAMGWALGQLPFGTAQNTQLTWQAACERCPATALPASVSLLRFLQFQKVIPLLCVCVCVCVCVYLALLLSFIMNYFQHTENYKMPTINLPLDVCVVHQHKYLIIFSSVFTFT